MPIIILCKPSGSEEGEELFDIAAVQFGLTLYCLNTESDDGVHILQYLPSACRYHSLKVQTLSGLLPYTIIELILIGKPLHDIEDEMVDSPL